MVVIKDIVNKEDISRKENEGPQGNAIETSILGKENKECDRLIIFLVLEKQLFLTGTRGLKRF